MTVTDKPIVTLFRTTTPSQHREDLAANRKVIVTTERLQPTEDEPVAYEVHVPRELCEPTDDPTRFLVGWADAMEHPYQVIA